MALNIEIKARIHSVASLLQPVAAIADGVMSDGGGAAEVAAAHAEAIHLMGRLGVEARQLIDVAYVDLAAADTAARP